MKHLFFLLILCNIVIYLWETGVGRSQAPQDGSETAASLAEERIILVKELAENPSKAPGPSINTKDEAEATAALPGRQDLRQTIPLDAKLKENKKEKSCFQIGPYSSSGESQSALKALGTSLGGVMSVKRPSEAVNGYWILYPSAATLEAARANHKMLLNKGFKDAWIIDKGENRNAISLALVRNKDQADEAIGRYRAQGVEVEVKPRMNLADKWWLEIRGPADRASVESYAPNPARVTSGVEVKTCE